MHVCMFATNIGYVVSITTMVQVGTQILTNILA